MTERTVFLTADQIDEAMLDGDAGFCVTCREEHHMVEPDAEGYRCDACGAFTVYGLEQLLLMGLVRTGGDDETT